MPILHPAEHSKSLNWPQSPSSSPHTSTSLATPHWRPCCSQTYQPCCGHRAFELAAPFPEMLPRYLHWLSPSPLSGLFTNADFSVRSSLTFICPPPSLLIHIPCIICLHDNTHQIYYAFYLIIILSVFPKYGITSKRQGFCFIHILNV